MTTQKYHTASRELLTQARNELAVEDVRQASEKGWGSAAQMVKAIAASRGWEHKGHHHLFAAVMQLRRETSDQNLSALFHVANSLHSNFYEDDMDAETVADALNYVEQFVDFLEPFLP